MDSFAGLFTLGGIVGSEEERKVCDVLASVAEGARGLAAFTLARQPLAETARACRFRDGKAEL